MTTTREPQVEVIGGVTVTDPYRWLEDDADPDVQNWQRERDADTAAALAASPHWQRVKAAVEATFVDVLTYAAPQRFGGRWFRTVVPKGGTAPLLEVAKTPTGPGRVLHDPASTSDSATLAVWTPSRDGKQVIVADNTRGAMLQVKVLDVDSGEILLDGLEQPGTYWFVWHPDGSGFFHNALTVGVAADGTPYPESQIWWQPLEGEPQQQDVTIDHPMAWPIDSTDGRYVAVLADQTAPRPRWVRDLSRESGWQPFLPGASSMYKGTFVGDEYWAVTNDTSGWCRLVAIPLASSADSDSWRELVPARPGTKLLSVTPCGNRLALASVVAGVSRLAVLGRDGTVEGDVVLPTDGAVGKTGVGHMMGILSDVVAPDSVGDACTFVLSGLGRAPAAFRADLATQSVEELVPPSAELPAGEVELREVHGPHGPVQYRVARRAETPLDGTAPVIVTGYGGFNVPWLPCYWPMAAAWTALGGVWVHAHLRGGGEQDDEFWQAGRMHRKQGSFDDLYAVIEDLHGRGECQPESTGVWGSSNGGLLVGAAVTQRPELFRAAVAQVPILDLLQSRKDPATIGVQLADYGNPDDPADAPVLLAYSPYHNVRNATAYPAIMFDSGAHDPNCPPWHSRKTAARIADASSSGRRVLLRVREGSGHNDMTKDRLLLREIEELCFFADELPLS